MFGAHRINCALVYKFAKHIEKTVTLEKLNVIGSIHLAVVLVELEFEIFRLEKWNRMAIPMG